MERPYFDTVWKPLGEAIGDFHLIEDGDLIGVGISGGKDSLVLTWFLSELRRFAPVKFEIVGLTSDAGWGADYGAVDVFCRRLGVDYAVKASNIGPVVFEDRHEKSPCALCAHLRRGAVNAMARERGCNKVALAHHLDDAIETLLMSMFYEGRIQCFLPKTHLDKSGLFVIRPLVYVEERVVERVALDLELPVVKNPCPAAGHTKRHYVKQVVSELSAETPSIRSRLKACLKSLWRKGVPV